MKAIKEMVIEIDGMKYEVTDETMRAGIGAYVLDARREHPDRVRIIGGRNRSSFALRPATSVDRSCFCRNCFNYECINQGEELLMVCNRFISRVVRRNAGNAK